MSTARGERRPAGPPTARVVRRGGAWWIVPLAAAAVAAWLGWSAWRERGVIVEVEFPQAHGLKAGDPVRYRGVDVGTVRAVDVNDRGGVDVRLGLEQAADTIARGGSRFWLVRPEIGFDRVAGLEALVGARYVAVLPGDGPPQRRFIGVDRQPVIDAFGPGDLEVVVEGDRRGGLAAGSPVTYRGVPVGVVLDVTLAPDAAGVEIRVLVRGPFAPLVRERTVFWDSGGVALEANWITGLSMEIDSFAALLRGSLAMALPDDPGPPAAAGARFALASGAPGSWEDWRPRVLLGVPSLPHDWAAPRPLRGRLVWRNSGIFGSGDSRAGLVLPTDRGLLAPRSLAEPPASARAGSAALEVAGRAMTLETARSAGDVVLVGAGPIGAGPGGAGAWPFDQLRGAAAPEDCMVLVDASRPAVPLPAVRLRAEGGRWLVDPAVPVDPALHGAPVVAQRDGRVVGLVAVEPGELAYVALLGPLLDAP